MEHPGQEHSNSLGLGKKWFYLGVGVAAGGSVRLPGWPELCLKTLARNGVNEQKEKNYGILANDASA